MKKALVVFAVISAALVSNASYLYWQVSTGDISELSNKGDVLFARIGSTETGSYLDNYYFDNDGTSTKVGQFVDVTQYESSGVFSADVGDSGKAYSYWVELYNSTTGKCIAYSETTAGGDIATRSWSDTAAISLTNLAPGAAAMAWHAGGYTAGVPEPTSAMLMLFGAAFLGLKRKNRSLA